MEQTTSGADHDQAKHIKIAIIGAGFSGIGMAIKLQEMGESDFLVFDRAQELGGTWRDNVYPGVECDIHTDLYSYSFEPKTDWKKNFAGGSEILGYLQSVAKKYDVDKSFRFSHELTEATWDDAGKRWRLETAGGTYTANVLISAMGYLSEPNVPEIAGLESFEGVSFHTANWDTSLDITGKNVALIGVGASGVQIVPEIQPHVGKLDIYQRSAPWFMSKHTKENAGFTGWALQNIPGFHWLMREYHRLTAEMVPWQYGRPSRAVMMQRIATSHLKKSVKDDDLREKLQPDYTIGCKRILFSDTYYPALQNPNVELVTDPIATVTSNGIETGDGTHRPADVIVLATGFKSARLPFGERIVGQQGARLSDTWTEGQHAYLGTTINGFPNFFTLLGPNTGVGHTSITLMMEAQINYVSDALSVMRDQGLTSVDVKPDVITAYNSKLQSELAPTVWNAGGCQSYYRNGDSKNTAIWPHTTINFAKKTRKFDADNYLRE